MGLAGSIVMGETGYRVVTTGGLDRVPYGRMGGYCGNGWGWAGYMAMCGARQRTVILYGWICCLPETNCI